MLKWRVPLTVSFGLAMGGACGFNGQSGGGGDAGLDGPVGPDAPPIAGCTMWQPFVSIDPCNSGWGTPGPLMLSNGTGTVNTATGVLTVGSTMTMLPSGELQRQAGDGAIRVFNLSALVVNGGATLTVTGTHAALFLVHDHVAINGTIEASALGAPLATAPGGNPTRCMSVGGNGVSAADDSAAGGGGGAHGGAGNTGGSGVQSGGGGGPADPASLVWRGGCSGGVGGSRDLQAGGAPGTGGGAIAISARGAITINGAAQVRANGAPGGGGAAGVGGGGGGSGGGIALDGVGVLINGRLCANGGAGGGGGGNNGAGQSGRPATCDNSAAGGGDAGTQGGNGGNGAAGTTDATVGANGGNNSGGGGGGGGLGKILLRSRNGVPAAIQDGAIVTPAHKIL